MVAGAQRASTLNAGAAAAHSAGERRHACKAAVSGLHACAALQPREAVVNPQTCTSAREPSTTARRSVSHGGPGISWQPAAGRWRLPAASQAVGAGACGGITAAAAAATAPGGAVCRSCGAQVPCARACRVTAPMAQQRQQQRRWEQPRQCTRPRAAGRRRQGGGHRQAAPQQSACCSLVVGLRLLHRHRIRACTPLQCGLRWRRRWPMRSLTSMPAPVRAAAAGHCIGWCGVAARC